MDKRGLTNTYYYNNSGCVTQVVASAAILTGDGVPNETATSTYTYTANNLPSTMTDPVGNGMQFVYDSGDPFKLDQSIRTSGGTAVYTNFNFYTNVSSLSTIGTTNYAYGVVWRQVQGGATNDFIYNGQGFKTEQIQYTATIQTPADTDPSIVTLFNYNERGQCYQQQVIGGALTQETFDAMGRTTSRQVFDQNDNNVNSEFFYYNDNGELQWYVGPRTNPVQYTFITSMTARAAKSSRSTGGRRGWPTGRVLRPRMATTFTRRRSKPLTVLATTPRSPTREGWSQRISSMPWAVFCKPKSWTSMAQR